MNEKEDTIAVVNTLVRLRIQPSIIHGVGVFALYPIPKGTKLYANIFPQSFRIPYKDFDKLRPKVRDLILERWPRVANDEPFMYPTEFTQAYMNHATKPNYDAVTDMALHDIKEGEEITEDYRKIPGWKVAHPWIKK